MAKKAVATLHEGSTDGRAYSKVIKMVKSPKTGAYIFEEKMVPNESGERAIGWDSQWMRSVEVACAQCIGPQVVPKGLC